MVDAPSLAVAFAAGVVSFLSPCCLPLVPGYLAAVAQVGPGEQRRRRLDPTVLLRSGLFVGTFTAIFVAFGLTATALGSFLFDNQSLLNGLAGALIVVMGLLFISSVFFARLNRDWRPEALIERAGRGGPMVAGAAFAIAWTPCVGPTLGAILGLAATSRGTAAGAGLLAAYSAGLALPFMFSAVAFDVAARSFAFVKRHYVALQVGSGVVLVIMGVLVLTGELFRLNIEIQQQLDRWDLNLFETI
jgi:cytochrome c-type biogenesis protein